MVSATPAAVAREQVHSWTPRHDANADLPADIAQLPIVMVNAYLVGDPSAGRPDWVLVDAALPFSARRILSAARARFGEVPPRAILLTHGHFDHVGALKTLLETWDVPVYAHELELPYLNGTSSYPPPDPTVGGGLMARMSPTYPKGPWDFGDRLKPLPADGSVPFLPEWRWIPTPGHSPGHVSFFRDRDRTLIAGDAFVTQRQESLVGVMTKAKVMRGPPMYFTPDWASAWESVERLAALKPALALTGHGLPMKTPRLDHDLMSLARDFDEQAIPSQGRYVAQPAVTNKTDGVVSLPPPAPPDVRFMLKAALVGVVIAGAMGALAAERSHRHAIAERQRLARETAERVAAEREAAKRASSPTPERKSLAAYASLAWTAFRLARRFKLV